MTAHKYMYRKQLMGIKGLFVLPSSLLNHILLAEHLAFVICKLVSGLLFFFIIFVYFIYMTSSINSA